MIGEAVRLTALMGWGLAANSIQVLLVAEF
jgi:hypothetical protein